MKQAKETLIESIFLLAACMSIAGVALICLFLFANGLPAMKEIGFGSFLLGRTWKPVADIYGIFPMIVGSVYVTGLALAMGAPVAILTAVYLAFFCPRKAYRVVKPAIELMAGIPSVVYGFFGIAVLVPLGSPHERGVFFAVLPAAKSGILAGIVLGLGRAKGETMAVIMVAGNQARMPKGVFQGIRTLTGNIVIEMGYATGLHREALIATGVVLFVFILIINMTLSLIQRGERR